MSTLSIPVKPRCTKYLKMNFQSSTHALTMILKTRTSLLWNPVTITRAITTRSPPSELREMQPVQRSLLDKDTRLLSLIMTPASPLLPEATAAGPSPEALREARQVAWLWSRSSYIIHLWGHLSTVYPLIPPTVHRRARTATEEPYQVTSWLPANYGDFLSSGQRELLTMINTPAWQDPGSPDLIARTFVLAAKKVRIAALVMVTGCSLCPLLGLITGYFWPLTFLDSPKAPDVTQVQLNLRLRTKNKQRKTNGEIDEWKDGWMMDDVEMIPGWVLHQLLFKCLWWTLCASCKRKITLVQAAVLCLWDNSLELISDMTSLTPINYMLSSLHLSNSYVTADTTL